MAKKVSYNSKFLPSQKRIDGQGTSGKLKIKGKGSTMATFDTPAQDVLFDTQSQKDFNAYPKPKKVPNRYQSKKITFKY